LQFPIFHSTLLFLSLSHPSSDHPFNYTIYFYLSSEYKVEKKSESEISSFFFRALKRNSKIRLYLPFRVEFIQQFSFFYRIISLRHDIVIYLNAELEIPLKRRLYVAKFDAAEDFTLVRERRIVD
jgi:hypothetical protein